MKTAFNQFLQQSLKIARMYMFNFLFKNSIHKLKYKIVIRYEIIELLDWIIENELLNQAEM